MSGADPTEIWQVAFSSGEIRPMSLDDIDAAFEEGKIQANTLVVAPGTTEWVRLGAVAGLDEEAAAPPPPPRQAPAPQPAQSLAPVAFDPAILGALDFEPPPFRSNKKRSVMIVLGGVAALGIAIAAMTSSGEAPPVASAAGAAANAHAAPPLVNPNAKPVETAAATPAPGTPATLTEEQRKALLDADKARDAKHKASSKIPGPPSRSPRTKEADPFNKGNDSHDPLNSKL